MRRFKIVEYVDKFRFEDWDFVNEFESIREAKEKLNEIKNGCNNNDFFELDEMNILVRTFNGKRSKISIVEF